MTQFWPGGLKTKVEIDDGEESIFAHKFGLSFSEVPSSFSWQNNQHQVEEIFAVWRVDINWWRDRSWRTYFLTATKSGLLVSLFKEMSAGDWYLQRVFD